MGDADDLEILLKAAAITQQMHRDVRRLGWLKSLVCAVLSGVTVLVGATWAVRGYLDQIRQDIRQDIKTAVEPLAAKDHALEVRDWELDREIAILKARVP